LTLSYALAIIVIAGQANEFPRPGPTWFGFLFVTSGAEKLDSNVVAVSVEGDRDWE